MTTLFLSIRTRCVPLQTTAIGKTVLAYTPSEQSTCIVHEELSKVIDNTMTDRETLFTELAVICQRGYAMNDAERGDGMRCMGAPISERNDEVLGAVSVSVPTSRMYDDRLENEIPRWVRSTASVIKINMMYS